MRNPGIYIKLYILLLVLALAFGSEVSPQPHGHSKKSSNQLKKKKGKHKDKSKGKKQKSSLQFLQQYQQKYGSELIKVNDISVNVPQIRQYSVAKDINPSKNENNGRQMLQKHLQSQASKVTKIKQITVNVPQIQQQSIVKAIHPSNDYEIGAYNLQFYQQRQGIRQIKINEMLVKTPEIRQYSILKQIYPQKNVKVGLQELPRRQQRQEKAPILVKEIIASVPQIQQYSIVKEIYPSTIFNKRRDTQTIVKQLESKWTLQQSKQLLEHNQKIIKLNNQISQFIDKQHDKKQSLPVVKNQVGPHSEKKPIQSYQRPNKEEDKKKNDLIQEIKKEIMRKQLLRKQKEKEQQRKRKQAQQIRKFDEQQKQRFKKQAEQEEKRRKQKQKQQAARLEQIQRKRKMNEQKYRKQQQMQMSSIAKSFDAMLMNNPKMQDLLRKKIQAEHLEDEAAKRSAQKIAKQKAKAAQSRDNQQTNKHANMKDRNKKVQPTNQPINPIDKADITNPDQGKKQQNKQDSILKIKQLQENKPQGKDSKRYQQANNRKVIFTQKTQIDDKSKQQKELEVPKPTQAKQNNEIQIDGNKNQKEVPKTNILQQPTAKKNKENQHTDKNQNQKQPRKQQVHNSDKPSQNIPQQSKAIQSFNDDIKSKNQGTAILGQNKIPSVKQDLPNKQLSNMKPGKSPYNSKQNVIGKEKQNLIKLKQKPGLANIQKQSEKNINQKIAREKSLNIQDIFGTASSKAQLKQQLLKKVKKYEQERQAKRAKKALLQASFLAKRYQGQAKNSMNPYQQPNQQVKHSLTHQDQKEIKNTQNPVHRSNMRGQEDTDLALFKQFERRIQSSRNSKQKIMKQDNLKPHLVNKGTPFIQYVIYFIFALFIILAICSRLQSFNQGPHQSFIKKITKGSRGSLIPEQDLQI